MSRISRHLIRIFLLLACVLGSFSIPASDAAEESSPLPLTFAERVACVEKVEDVYWSHRIWPDANPTPKPERTEIVPHSQITAKVEESLLLEAALEHLWRESLTPQRIQLELDRIAKSTQNPRLLADVFLALDNDPTLIAECYVRPRLVERLLHRSYAWDPALHRDLRDRALEELSGVGFISDLDATSATTTETTWVPADGPAPEWTRSDDEVALDPDEWKAGVRRLAGRFPMEMREETDAPVPVDPGF